MDRQILEEARRTIELLRDTVTVLHRELEEARTHGAGEALTAEALHHEIAQMRASLAERDARIAQLEEALHLLEERRRREAEGPALSEDALAGAAPVLLPGFPERRCQPAGQGRCRPPV